jgi:hypothetical protein
MFIDNTLQEYLETSSVIKSQSAVVAEWNMNIASNILKVGNYRYRPTETSSPYYQIADSFDTNDNNNFYTGATDSDIVIDGGTDDDGLPLAFKTKKDKEKLLFSLEDCFGRFRPRSGINKLRFFANKYTHHSNAEMFQRPRYYMADRTDPFKYWTSYRTENATELGIAKDIKNNQYYISDAAPFVTYKDAVPANRIVVKMQTNVGNVDLGPFNNGDGSINDPLYGLENQTTPTRWKIQYLNVKTAVNDSGVTANIIEPNWIDAISFNPDSIRRDGTRIIKENGYVELSYGLIVPEEFRDFIYFGGTYPSEAALPDPEITLEGSAYFVQSDTNQETISILVGGEYVSFPAKYGWSVEEETVTRLTNFVTDLTDPTSFVNSSTNQKQFKEFQYIGGLRIVAETMNVFDSTFDLIEMSPRLAVNLADKTTNFSITKSASDLGISGLPVGQLLAGTGTINLFDYDQAFFDQNTTSIINKFLNQNVQFKLYEVVVDVNGFDYYLPIKTMYSEGFPEISSSTRDVSLQLRDMFFYLESMTAPQLLISNVSLSYAVALLLDYVGFSNYSFKRIENESDLIIPYFMVGPDKTVAEVLSELAISSQSAMFFDEYNNFIVMSKGYLLPTALDRSTDIVLHGSNDFEKNNQLKNSQTTEKLANIVDLSSQNNHIYNDGMIQYTTRYIQKSYGSLKQANMVDRDKTWIYKPALLWEVSATESTKTKNEEVSQQQSYVLGAIPLNSDLSNDLPIVSGHKVINNIIDLGEGVYWLPRYKGYFYANGEIIKYDAVQFSVPGLSATQVDDNVIGDTVWITSTQEYQKYFAKIPFNGKIYPTGLVKIYSEPSYENISGITRLKNGAVAKHGRMQFGTGIRNIDGTMSPVYHYAGLNPQWSDNSNLRGAVMETKYLFGGSQATEADTTTGMAGVDNTRALATTRNGIIKNFLSNVYIEESTVNRLFSTQTGTVQSSSLIMNGSAREADDQTPSFISYVYKSLPDKFVHFGTRMRIIGSLDNNEYRGQSPSGAKTYYTSSSSTPEQSSSIGGSSGGIGIMIDPGTNQGYYFEIAALTENNLSQYADSGNLHNLIFYKLKRNVSATSDSDKAIPIKLWGGTGSIIVDDGKLTGQYRMAAEEKPTVYDIAVEYQQVGNTLRFYLYVNGVMVGVVDDTNPLTIRNNMALFVRSSSSVMFENIYALANNYSQNTTFNTDIIANTVFADQEINVSDSFRKYAISGLIQSTYLSGIGTLEPPKYRMYFEEFGTIMREAAYFNVRYDKAYPALYAVMSPTFNKIKGYTISGFIAGAYKAEFLVFNNTDTALNFDSTSGNYLRIQGVTFTQQSAHELTVDEYYSKKSDLSNPEFIDEKAVMSSQIEKQVYQDIKFNRMTYGNKQFSIAASYLQNADQADSLMQWLSNKIMKIRKSVGINVFGMPILQLGDIIEIDYKNTNNINEVAPDNTRFVVYSIEYSRSKEGPETKIYVSEVTE